jgi:hypothetical protein
MINSAGRGASKPAFPRGAWERENLLCSRSHAPRGNAGTGRSASGKLFSFPRSAWECLHWTLCVRQVVLVPTLRVGMPARTLRVLQVVLVPALDAPRPASCSRSHAPRTLLYTSFFLRLKKIRFFEKIGFLSWCRSQKNPIFSKNRIFKLVSLSKKIRSLSKFPTGGQAF